VIDLQPVAEQMISAGIDPKQSTRDTWHPNQLMGEAAANYIVEQALHLRAIPGRIPAAL
jgi:hypothetical protein